MDSRSRLLATLSFAHDLPPPRYESEFSEEVIEAWRRRGDLADCTPEKYFRLDRREDLPIEWRRPRYERRVVDSAAEFRRFRRAFDPRRGGKLPRGWRRRVEGWRERDHALWAAPWNEGLLQVVGVSDWGSFARSMLLFRDDPALVEAAMDHYAGYLEALLDRILPAVRPDYALFYEPIASHHAPVISPEDYARFALPALRRVVACLERHGVRYRFVWTSGRVVPLVPLWIEAGVNGLAIRQAAAAGISYLELRSEFDARLRFFGGVDSRAVAAGPEALKRVLARAVRPLLEEGGYVPHLDDTVRAEIPFEGYRCYREKLDALVAEVFGA